MDTIDKLYGIMYLSVILVPFMGLFTLNTSYLNNEISKEFRYKQFKKECWCSNPIYASSQFCFEV